MKQMRSRFRLLTLLLACAFLLTLAVCAGSAFQKAGVSLDQLLPVSSLPGAGTPGPSGSPDLSPGPENTPGPEDASPSPDPLPGTDISPNPEYNVFGL